MSLDIVEIALSRFTDWATFEQMAGEIMRGEGFPGIKLLGGVGDGGQDACVEQFYEAEGQRSRTVFQFTLREDAATKVKETIERLDEVGTEFQKLVLVTPCGLSAAAQRAAVKVARSSGVELEIFDRKTIANRLSDFDNQIFHRVFPDIEKQLAGILRHKKMAGTDAQQMRELEYLKVCCAIVFNPQARHTRDAAVDHTVLAVMYHHRDGPMTPVDILQASESDLGKGLLADEQQVSASLRRLVSEGSVQNSRSGDQYELSTQTLTHIEATQALRDAENRTVIGDLVEEVCMAMGTAVPEETRRLLERNAHDLLAEYFRTNGLDLAASFLNAVRATPVYIESLNSMLTVANRDVPAELADLLIAAVGEALSNPSDEQATLFAKWSRAYLVLQVMNVDPSLREFQSTRFSSKTFILDTDVVLEAIIKELPLSPVYRTLSSNLVSRNARVVIPEAVLQEVITHLNISPRTYHRFGPGLLSMSEELVKMGVRNALVRGFWYYGGEANRTQVDFDNYHANYYDDSHPRRFVEDVIREALPGVVIEDPIDSTDLDVAREHHPEVGNCMIDIATHAERSEHRKDDETAELARHDTDLMLAVLKLNENLEEDRDSVLGSRAYIVTASSRYVRVAFQCKIEAAVSTSPYVLVGLLEMVSPNSVSDRQFVALFDNPLLQQVAEACWDDLLVLLDNGVQLRDKSLTRLRHDCEKSFQASITDITRTDEKNVDGIISVYSDLANRATGLGYKLSPALARVQQVSEIQKKEIKELLSKNQELREAIEGFGKKKERWLKRQDKKHKKS